MAKEFEHRSILQRISDNDIPDIPDPTKIHAGNVKMVMHPQEFINLQKELSHPANAQVLKEVQASGYTDPVDVVQFLASEVGIILHGMYDDKDLLNIVTRITERIAAARVKRSMIVIGPTDC